MAAFKFHKRQTRRWWYAGATLMAAAFFTVFYVAGAGAAKPPPPTQPAGPYQVPTGPIGQGSGFADNDGGTTQPNSGSDYSPSATVDPNATNQPSFDPEQPRDESELWRYERGSVRRGRRHDERLGVGRPE